MMKCDAFGCENAAEYYVDTGCGEEVCFCQQCAFEWYDCYPDLKAVRFSADVLEMFVEAARQGERQEDVGSMHGFHTDSPDAEKYAGEDAASYHRRRRARQKKAGRCSECTAPASDGKSRCLLHAAAKRQRERKGKAVAA